MSDDQETEVLGSNAKVAPKNDPYFQVKQKGDNNEESNNALLPKLPSIDYNHQRYPYCIVWTPIPCITTLIPCIGHTGFCTSFGVIHDFAGPYFVSVDDMAFGWPCKYVQLDPTQEELEEWDKAVAKGDAQFKKEVHNLFT